jgi:hypothetical protein
MHGIFFAKYCTQEWDLFLKVRNKERIKLHESHKHNNVMNNDWRRQVFEQLMLQHHGMVVLRANFNSNKFELFGEDMRLLQTQQ